MRLRWIGHAAFLCIAEDGTRILTDPYNAEVGYRVPLVEADYVTVSHEHFDHNSLQNVPGNHEVLKGPGERKLKGGIVATGIATFHDDQGGAKRGKNTVFCLDLPDEGETVRLCHLGDLGHQLTADQLAAVGAVDVLLIPTGGTYTLDPAGAATQVAAIKPRIVVPMHYKTAALSFPLKPVDDFLGEMVGSAVDEQVGAELAIGGEELKTVPPSATPRIAVLDYVR